MTSVTDLLILSLYKTHTHTHTHTHKFYYVRYSNGRVQFKKDSLPCGAGRDVTDMDGTGCTVFSQDTRSVSRFCHVRT